MHVKTRQEDSPWAGQGSTLDEIGSTSTAPASGALSVWTERSAEIVRLQLGGELSAATVKALERHIEFLACCENRVVIVDLARLTYLDATGARVLVGLGHYVRGVGGQCRVVGAAHTDERAGGFTAWDAG
jgi:anti-anti-sigma factor